MAMSRPIHHNAPAGQKYSSIRDAGEQTLATYCQRFPQSPDRESFILPILFKSEHPENVDQNHPSLSEADKRLLTGLNINIRGERGEYEVYKVFYTIVRQSPTESILVLHGYKLDNDNGRNLKEHAIMNELPTINLSGVNMKKEHDFVIVVRNIGIVLCEVKASASDENIASAEAQLHNSATFVQQIFAAIVGPTSPQLPVVKVIIAPKESSAPSSPTKHNDCHVIYQDDLQNFTPKWTQIVNELNISAKTCLIPQNHFEHLVQFLVGVWLMKPMTKKTYGFDVDASLSTDVAAIDLSLKKAEFAPTKQAQKLTNDVATSMNEIFQQVEDLNIMYLSPKQKSLYDNYKHALIHSHAGTGKTMLIIFKIIELLEGDPTQKVLLVAPYPHSLRLQRILQKHKITTDVVTKFPYAKSNSIGNNTKRIFKRQPPLLLPTCNVLIIALRDFFMVPVETLMQYDVSMFNIFVDDLHSIIPTPTTFADIGNFIDSTYTIFCNTNQYAWFAIDVVQQATSMSDARYRSEKLFTTSSGSLRTFSISVVTMTNGLRSAKEITDVIDSAPQIQTKYARYDTNHVLSNIDCGHHITTGTRVLYEKLKLHTDTEHVIPFVCDRVCSLLHSLTKTTCPQPSNFPLSSVSVLLHYGDLQEHKPFLKSMIRQHFNVGVQSIEEQLLSNNTKDVIIDNVKYTQSFESPIVVHVISPGFSIQKIYNALTRARTQCVILDVKTRAPPLKLHHIDCVIWKGNNGTFEKVV